MNNIEEAMKWLKENDMNEEILWEMANIYKDKTNLPINVWVDEVGNNRKNKHYLPRIKVQNDYSDRATTSNFSVSISKEPKVLAGTVKIKQKELNEVFEWIKLNYDLLIKHWEGKINTDELKDNIKQISK